MNVATNKFWRKTYSVEAVRLTLENYKLIADFLGGEYFENSAHQGPYIQFNREEAVLGDWVVRITETMYLTFSHEDFVKKFQTHAERQNNDEKYAKIYALVKGAMIKQDTATYHGESCSAEMDLVAIETVRKLMEEL